MIIDIEEARDTLRLDGDDNDEIIMSLLAAIPPYLEASTGKDWNDKNTHPLAQTAAKFILTLWYNPEGQDTRQLKRTIETLLVALTTIGRAEDDK